MTFDDAKERIRTALNHRVPRRLHLAGFRPAAVLVPILRRADSATVLFTRRTATMRQHGGQVSFPGGALERDETARDGALREAWEEVGLDPARVEILGELGDYLSISS